MVGLHPLCFPEDLSISRDVYTGPLIRQRLKMGRNRSHYTTYPFQNFILRMYPSRYTDFLPKTVYRSCLGDTFIMCRFSITVNTYYIQTFVLYDWPGPETACALSCGERYTYVSELQGSGCQISHWSWKHTTYIRVLYLCMMHCPEVLFETLVLFFDDLEIGACFLHSKRG